MKWAEAIPGLAAVAGLVGGIVTAIAGGQLVIALFVIGALGLPTVILAGVILILLDLARRFPFMKLADSMSDKEVFWAYYLAILAIIAGLITWASVDRKDFSDTARDFDFVHFSGIAVLVIAALVLGGVLQRAIAKGPNRAPE